MQENIQRGYGILIPVPKIEEVLSEGFSYPKYAYSILTNINSREEILKLIKENEIINYPEKYELEIKKVQAQYDNNRISKKLKEDIYTDQMIEIAQKYQKAQNKSL